MDDPAMPSVTFGAGARERRSDDKLLYVVVILGAIVAVPPAMSLLGLIRLDLGTGQAHGSALGVLWAVGYTLLGVGLMRRRETAREIYCVLAVISLLLLGVGIVREAIAPGASDARTTEAPVLRREITSIEASPYYSPDRRAHALSTARSRLAAAEREPSASPHGIGRFIPGLIVTLVPLLFLMKLRVRDLFS